MTPDEEQKADMFDLERCPEATRVLGGWAIPCGFDIDDPDTTLTEPRTGESETIVLDRTHAR